jgi:hypothetical protein
VDFCFFYDICYKKQIMEIKEVISYNLNIDTNILEVVFRTIDDDEDVQRTDHIDYGLAIEYGYELETESFDFFDEEEDEIEKFDDEIDIDEELLVSFLNEYYMINQDLVPKPEIY